MLTTDDRIVEVFIDYINKNSNQKLVRENQI